MAHPKNDRSLVILKPDAVQRGLVGEIIQRFERVGLKMVAMKMIMAQEQTVWDHYNKDEAWFQEKGENVVKNREEAGLPIEKEAVEYGRDIIGALVKYVIASPVVVMVLEGNDAPNVVTKLVGGTEPTTSDIGTIRGDLAIDSYAMANLDERGVRNLIHCSEDHEEAEREAKLWFSDDEIINYRLIHEAMLYDVNLDGLTE